MVPATGLEPVTQGVKSLGAAGHPIHVLGAHPSGRGLRLLPSMGSVGDCFDNAGVESLWSHMRDGTEALLRKRSSPCSARIHTRERGDNSIGMRNAPREPLDVAPAPSTLGDLPTTCSQSGANDDG